MADEKITDFTEYTTPTADDVLPIVDIGNDETKKIKFSRMIAEGNFTTYTIQLDQSGIGSGATGGVVIVGIDGSVLVRDGDGSNITIVKLDGTVVTTSPTAASFNRQQEQDASVGGKYKILLDTTDTGYVRIYKDNVLLQSITIDEAAKWDSKTEVGVGISADGKYIALFGYNKTPTSSRLQIYEGA